MLYFFRFFHVGSMILLLLFWAFALHCASAFLLSYAGASRSVRGRVPVGTWARTDRYTVGKLKTHKRKTKK